MNEDLRDILRQGAAALGAALDDGRVDSLDRYLALLNKWNARVNLTAVRKERDQVVRLLVDSLAAAPAVRGPRVLDLGSGAGLPGLPLKIARPELEVTLCESRNRKADFLKAARRELGLTGLEVFAGRAEDIGEKFDTVVTRAVSDLAELARLAGPLVKDGGLLVAMKGPAAAGEVEAARAALERAGLALVGVREYELPGRAGRRSLVILEKPLLVAG